MIAIAILYEGAHQPNGLPSFALGRMAWRYDKDDKVEPCCPLCRCAHVPNLPDVLYLAMVEPFSSSRHGYSQKAASTHKRSKTVLPTHLYAPTDLGIHHCVLPSTQ